MEVVYNQELKYSTVCEMMNDKVQSGGRHRDLQLIKWQKKYEIEKIGRGKYIIKRELTQTEKDEQKTIFKYGYLLGKFAKTHYIRILSELNDNTHCKDIINYECKFHPGIIQKTRADILIRSIGCPLCTYPMGRFEVMLYLGLKEKGAIHRCRLDGVEYDIILPKENIAVEIDGALFHSGEEEATKEQKKYEVAEANGYRLIKIYETICQNKYKNHREGDKIYINSYQTSSKKEQAEIISLIQQLLPYEHSETLWDEAAIYMREWKNNVHKVEQSHFIHQYSPNGDLVAEYKNFDEIKNAIASGEAFGFKWEVI